MSTQKVYYEDIDGELHPIWFLLKIDTSERFARYTVDAPFERFWPEDFHDSMSVITVAQAALVRDPFDSKIFSINLNQVIEDLEAQQANASQLHEASYFLVRIDDLEELLQLSVRELYLL
ncbi:hypothetical protein BTR22_19045 [Alkalihalophilus pseudofirmus]|uniref:hypothetical protein n=1 Tax=Alkalihalophilus pseudofirmus TaxID=79885 RepID=UPI0009519158|nr:hypothetical protein BTR22_19045 [Alkalihalophilus pseudofirmus]